MEHDVNIFTVRRTEPRPVQTVADIEDFHREFPFVVNPNCSSRCISLERDRKVIAYPGRPLPAPRADKGAEIDAFLNGIMAGVIGLSAIAALLIGAVL